MPKLGDLIAHLEAWAPPNWAWERDNTGLQLGDPEQPVRRVLIALDLTEAVVAQAASWPAELILTHHPPLYRPLRRCTTQDALGRMLLHLARIGCAVYSIHTNLDVAPGGVNDVLAERLGLRRVRVLEPMRGQLRKLVTFVPITHVELVRRALAEAGAGRIGSYAECAFEVRGTGSFRPLAGARPYLGEAGRLERVEEVRLEMEVPSWRLAAALEALRAVHPYEEPVWDVYVLERATSGVGMGRIGELSAPLAPGDFLEYVAERLAVRALRYAAGPQERISRVAVCGGAGADLWWVAAQQGADALVTADVRYHAFQEASGALWLLDAGHYETEAPILQVLAERLQRAFPDLECQVGQCTSPISTYVS
ncbi:MAG: Nif3-like dinuclear metal center hexameric protein [Bacteroidota bacterium]|nr:Nif3-like dinuclear metal center hexameric protein [Bacteroidota bacterium]MDW8137680.1 Nif3-like dinuclear metal center hexameric protein [Bacteroidota bacterium]